MCVRACTCVCEKEREREKEREMVIIIIALARNPPVPAFASVLVGLKNGQVWRSIAIETIIFLPKAKHWRSLNVVKFDQDCHLTILFVLGSIIMETTQIAWDLVLVNFPTSNTLMMTITL